MLPAGFGGEGVDWDFQDFLGMPKLREKIVFPHRYDRILPGPTINSNIFTHRLICTREARTVHHSQENGQMVAAGGTGGATIWHP
jgi:hypothetical protein